jgi:hypothetical protein
MVVVLVVAVVVAVAKTIRTLAIVVWNRNVPFVGNPHVLAKPSRGVPVSYANNTSIITNASRNGCSDESHVRIVVASIYRSIVNDNDNKDKVVVVVAVVVAVVVVVVAVAASNNCCLRNF